MSVLTKKRFQNFPACWPLSELTRLLDFQGFFSALYHFNRENFIFSTQLSLIQSCLSLCILKEILLACLLKPARLLDSRVLIKIGLKLSKLVSICPNWIFYRFFYRFCKCNNINAWLQAMDKTSSSS